MMHILTGYRGITNLNLKLRLRATHRVQERMSVILVMAHALCCLTTKIIQRTGGVLVVMPVHVMASMIEME